MRKKLWLCAAMFLSIVLLGSGLIPQMTQLITKGAEVNTMKQNVQSDFTYVESMENVDETDLRYRAKFDLNWKFIRQDVAGAEGKDFDDSSWRLLNLPYDWSIEGEYSQANPAGGSGGYLPTGIGWYRKTLTVPAEWKDGRQVSLVFDGVFCNSTVYVDGVKVGGREYGWLSFSCDITARIQGKDSVVVAVKVDNSVQPAARWYTGSGIYSHVWVVATEGVRVAENGTYITTPADGTGVPTGDMTLETVVENKGASDAEISLISTVYQKSDHRQVAQVTATGVTVPAAGKITVNQTAQVIDPLLWNTKTPNLYYVKTQILSGSTVVDDYITVFGFRAVTYDVNGLYLNGEKIELKGVANHWALGSMGAAQTTNIIRYKIQMMKNMGVNCIRTAHNACPPEFYQLCNEMGMMVLDELFEGERGKTAGDYGTRWFTEHWQEDTEYWIRRDRNHPCVVAWSIGNETGSDTDNTGISDYIHLFDTTRPTTGSAIHYGVDIPGANGQSEPASFTQPVATLPLIATEAPHTHAVRGVYRTQTWFRGRTSETGSGNTIPHLTEKEIFQYDWSASAVAARTWPSDYDNATSQVSVREHWTRTRDEGWRIGEFRWTGFDYLGEANYVLGGWPYRMFHSGAVDTALFEKDMYYLYQSMWSEEPMLHLLPSWTHPIMESGTEIPVWVYSNYEIVELFLNGRSLGRLDRGPVEERDWDSIQFDWLVPYEAGTLKAVAYDRNGNVLAEEEYKTASAPSAITLENTTGETFPQDPSFVGQVTVTTTDKDGNFYPYGENRAYYYVSGPAYIKAADNGSPTDTESHVNYNRNAFMGLNKVFVSPTQDAGDILFTAASILGEKRQLTSNLVSVDVQQLALRGNPAKDVFEIYYTTDGATPTKASEQYTGPFEVELGTTVKAAVYADGESDPMFVMEEAFGENEGMYWAGTSSNDAEENVYSAKDAVLSGESLQKLPYGHEEQYVNFNNGTGSVEYTVNAPKAGPYYVAVCYNNGSGTTGGSKSLDVLVNGASIGNQKFYYNGAWDTFWSYHILSVYLTKGENKIKFDSPSAAGPNLKQLILWPAEDVYTAAEAIRMADDTLATHYSAFDDKALDVGSGGTATWTVTDKAAGEYKLLFWYSTPNGGLREVSGALNGQTVALWSGQKVSPDYGSSWGYCETTVSLAPGTNVLSVTAPSGGALIGAMVLQPVKEYTVDAVWIDSSCVENIRLAGSDTAPLSVGTDTVTPNAAWDRVTDRNGLIYLVNRGNGKLLTADGTTLSLSDGDENGDAQWQRAGEAEHYDYLVHPASGKILALDAAGNLIVDNRENYDESNMKTNRAYWYLHTLPNADFAFAPDTPTRKAVDSVPFYVKTVGGEDGTVTYSLVSGPATVDADSGLVTLTKEPGTVVLKATRNGTRSVTHTISVTGSQIATAPATVYPTVNEEGNGPGENVTWTPIANGTATAFKVGSGTGGSYLDFNNCYGSVNFTVTVPNAGEYYLAIGYNTGNERRFDLNVNGTDLGQYVCTKNGAWYAATAYHFVKVSLMAGENTVQVARPASYGKTGAPCIQELRVYSTAEWHSYSDNPSFSGSTTLTAVPTGLDGYCYDVGQNGFVSWKVIVPVSGRYKITAAYSSSSSDTRAISFLINGSVAETMNRTATGAGYGDGWGLLTTREIVLNKGETEIALQCPGGSFLSGVRLELVKSYDADSSFGDLTVQLNPYVPGSKVYSLDLLWENDDMAFDYNAGSEGVWNPGDHIFEGSVEGKWEDKDLKITVVNHSNQGVTATVSIEDGDSADGLTVTPDKDSELLPTAEGTTVENAPKTDFILTIDGTPTESVEKVASATVSFSAAE